jgi:hypothetical protein
MLTKKYTHNPKSIDPRKHAAAVQAARLFQRYGTSDARQAWQKTLATYRQAGRTELEAIQMCTKAHPELAQAYARAPRSETGTARRSA